MNTKKWSLLVAVGVSLCAASAFWPKALAQPTQAQGSIPRYECAIIKWDGPDKIQFIMPDRAEMVHVFKQPGVSLPKDIHDEEFCVAWACNKLGQEGWKPMELHATRVLLCRPLPVK